MLAAKKRKIILSILVAIGVIFAATAIGLNSYSNKTLLSDEYFTLSGFQSKSFDFSSDPLPAKSYKLTMRNTGDYYTLVIYDTSDSHVSYSIHEANREINYAHNIKSIGFICYGGYASITFTLETVGRIDPILIYGPLGGVYTFIWLVSWLGLAITRKEESNLDSDTTGS